ncbi:histone-lysine N-methyltransferase family member SUVH9-like [Arachis stenosperma]|uniref:histone-lysine N-methyltransferase family member SUVH9-like n=1 Tax=Arachis stenosperma TaxID=217475 RepID=UPI0025AB8F2B|nr:histone-lysine N-methyltransferase family member SUVH9-like [Arachis stenosperma]
MDSLLSLQTPSNNPHPHSPPLQPTQTPLLVPKPEPLDDFFFSNNSQQYPHWFPHQQQPQPNNNEFELHAPPFASGSPEEHEDSELYNHFFRVSQLFRTAFSDTLFQNDAVPEPMTPQSQSQSQPNFQDSLSYASASNSQPEAEAEAEAEATPEADSRALVPVPPSSSLTVAAPSKRVSKKKELVRVSELSLHEQLHFREVVRRTRMIYDSIRALCTIEEEKRVQEEKRAAEKRAAAAEEERRAAAAAATVADAVTIAADEPFAGSESTVECSSSAETTVSVAVPAPESAGEQQSATDNGAGYNQTETVNRGEADAKMARRMRQRGDIRAAQMMRIKDLWLNRDKRIVGAIPGVYVGDVFLFRMELCVLGLHGQIQAGIDYLAASMSPNNEPIATSVIVSGGYEDDMDEGDVIIYTGQGGQAMNSVRQATHQKLESGNLALERSMYHNIEVRVIRGMKYEGAAAKSGKIYVYDGLYRISECWFDVGKSGFGVYKYKLVRVEGQPKMGSAILKEARSIRKSGVDFQPMYCLSVDISNKKEKVAVRLFNDIDDSKEPLCFDYLPTTVFPPFVFHQSGTATGCDCIDGCTDGCFCSMKNGGDFPYNQQGILVRGKPLIFECGPFCSCPPQCRNRVSQNGVKNRLEVFRSKQTGWGVRSLDLIQAGAFICEYAGVVLTREQAQLLTMNGDSLIYPNRFSERWAEWGDLSQVNSDYVRPSYPSIPPLDFSLDVSTVRNVACYMSHSSSPNVMVQFVLYDHNNLMFPHLMLFAMENIPPLRELSLDYGVADEWTGKLSICNG